MLMYFSLTIYHTKLQLLHTIRSDFSRVNGYEYKGRMNNILTGQWDLNTARKIHVSRVHVASINMSLICSNMMGTAKFVFMQV